MSHTRNVLSKLPVMIFVISGLTSIQVTPSVCPMNVLQYRVSSYRKNRGKYKAMKIQSGEREREREREKERERERGRGKEKGGERKRNGREEEGVSAGTHLVCLPVLRSHAVTV